MNIDFYQNADYWVDLVRQFIEILTDFFGGLGIQIFKDAE